MVCTAATSGPAASRAMPGSAQFTGSGITQWPMPAAASRAQGNFSPGSILRVGATSEWASTRSGRMPCRAMISRQSASSVRTCGSGKSG